MSPAKKPPPVPHWNGDGPAEDRDYYRQYFGFDPVADSVDLGNGRFRLEATFPLEWDPVLRARGVTITARVDWQGRGATQLDLRNRIVFGLPSGEESSVDCVHAVVATLPAGEAAAVDWSDPPAGLTPTRTLEGSPGLLPPAGHFTALKSFVAGVAEFDAVAAIHQVVGLDRETPPGVTGELWWALWKAVRRLDEIIDVPFLRAILVELAGQVPADTLVDRLPELNHALEGTYYDFREYGDTGEPDYLEPLSARFEEALFGDAATRDFFLDVLGGVPGFLERALQSALVPRTLAARLLPRLESLAPGALPRLLLRGFWVNLWPVTPFLGAALAAAGDDVAWAVVDGWLDFPAGDLPDDVFIRAGERAPRTLQLALLCHPETPSRVRAWLALHLAEDPDPVDVVVTPPPGDAPKPLWRVTFGGDGPDVGRRTVTFDFPVVPRTIPASILSPAHSSSPPPTTFVEFWDTTTPIDPGLIDELCERATLFPLSPLLRRDSGSLAREPFDQFIQGGITASLFLGEIRDLRDYLAGKNVPTKSIHGWTFSRFSPPIPLPHSIIPLGEGSVYGDDFYWILVVIGVPSARQGWAFLSHPTWPGYLIRCMNIPVAVILANAHPST